MAATREDIKTILRQMFVRNMSAEDAEQASDRFLDLYFADDALDMSDAELTANTVTAANGVTVTAGDINALVSTVRALDVTANTITADNGITVTAEGASVLAGNVTIDDNVIITNGTLYVNTGGAAITGNVSVANAAPIITIENTTNSDTHAGRPIYLKFVGRGADGVSAVGAQILVDKSGSANDDACRMRFGINDGNDANSPTEPFIIQANGRVYFAQSPYIQASSPVNFELSSTTEEDIDGGRESYIRFQGEQSGGEQHDLCWLEVEHDGSADDQRGRFRVRLNDGNDGGTPSVNAAVFTPETAKFSGGIVLGTSTVNATGDNVNVNGVGIVFVETDNTVVTIGSFANGVAGQVVHVVYSSDNSVTNSVTLEHAAGTGAQDFVLPSGANEVTALGGGWTLVCDGTSWFASGKALS